ncbi:radical SAM protein [Candidatus Woesearchaeota archaeon]|nr:radical SAM protein [Candidatus Woesearchaeota archaeon]
MKVLLVIPPNIGRYVVATIPHAGIAYLSAMLKKEGHKVCLADMRMHASNDYLFSKIKEFKPDMTGMTTASIGYKMAYEIIGAIKDKYPKMPVAIGGSYASTVHSKILEETKVDYVVYGEGERTFLELAGNKELVQINGLIYRNGDEIIMNPPYPLEQDLDKLPFPDYELFDLDKMLEKRIPIVSTRGCPNRCTFCSIQLVMGHPFRTRSPENVLQEIEYWHKRGYDTFEFSDDNFTFNMPRAEKICDLIIESGMKLKLIFGNGLRADRVNPTLLKKLRKAGTFWIAYSLESSDPHSLELLKKDLTLEQLKKSVADTKALGIKTQVNFIIGNPGETWEGFENDLKVADELNVDQLRFYNMIPYPGTEMFEWVKQNGRFLHQPEDFLNNLNYWGEEPVFETDEFTREERIKAYRIGQEKIMKLFLRRHFGRFLGAIGFHLWKRPLVQKHGMNIATKAWIGLKRLRVMQA